MILLRRRTTSCALAAGHHTSRRTIVRHRPRNDQDGVLSISASASGSRRREPLGSSRPDSAKVDILVHTVVCVGYAAITRNLGSDALYFSRGCATRRLRDASHLASPAAMIEKCPTALTRRSVLGATMSRRNNRRRSHGHFRFGCCSWWRLPKTRAILLHSTYSRNIRPRYPMPLCRPPEEGGGRGATPRTQIARLKAARFRR